MYVRRVREKAFGFSLRKRSAPPIICKGRRFLDALQVERDTQAIEGNGKLMPNVIDRRTFDVAFELYLKLTRFLVVAAATFSTAHAVAGMVGVPLLRVTAPNGEQSVLIGSMHVPVEGLREPAPSIFVGAKHYVVEHTGPSSSRESDIPGLGVRTDWAKSMSDREVQIYFGRAKCAGIPEAIARELLKLPTPHDANYFAYAICPPPRNVVDRDSYMQRIAPPSLASHPDALEDPDWVEGQRRKVPSDSDAVGFKWALDHDPKVVLEQTRDALNDGDYDALRKQVLESFGSPKAGADYGRFMVDERNAAWIPNLRRLLDDGPAVIVVGAMHIPGPTGLISLLRKSGYKIEEIEWPATDADR